jgi:N-acetylglucosamine-6-sulfatase
MNQHAAPIRRRALTAVTAVATAAATIAGLALLTTVSSTPSAASPALPALDGSATPGAGVEIGAVAAPSTTASPSTSPEGAPADAAGPSASPTTTGSMADIKNVVLVLADDLDWALFDRVPRLAALQDRGMTFTNHVVTDSLCCPSRTSILRSQYVHNHLVVSNSESTGGGWPTFKQRGEQRDCLPVWLNSTGVTTALYGKYLNDYTLKFAKSTKPPRGWIQWAVPMSGANSYEGYNYILNDNGRLRKYGNAPTDYLNDVLTEKATNFIGTAPDRFFLEFATFNPHRPAPVAPRNANTHLTDVAPRFPNYNAYGTNEPTWLKGLRPLGPKLRTDMDVLWRQRAQSAESVADTVDAIEAELVATGRAANTLIIVTSDNGFHAGMHRMKGGKRTAFREDTVVPMIAIGPGIAPGTRVDAMTSTVDLAPTITSVMGAQSPAWVDGRSLSGILGSGQVPTNWRTAALSESMGRSTPQDPDYQPDAPPNFTSLRTPNWLYVSYRNGERELYDVANDPYELNNIIGTADPTLVAALNSQLQAMRACAGPTCLSADSLPIPTPPSLAAASAAPSAS